jgi:GDP-mannose pyrophosphatase NudK
MSPGSVTEIVYFFIAEYSKEMQTSEGGGLDGHEDIEVLELSFDHAWRMLETGEIKDGKTIMLLQYLKLHNFL